MTFLDRLRSKSNRVSNYRDLPETVIIIPAWNEEKYIGKTIDLIRDTRLNVRIIVVDDGSRDKTADIARSKNVDVVSLSENRGKTGAFFRGLKEALKYDPEAIITLDADMVTVPRQSLFNLILNATRYSRSQKVQMFVAIQSEGLVYGNLCPTHLTGIRAFSIPAAYKLLSSKFKSLPRRFALETFLTMYFRGNTIKCNKAMFSTHNAHRFQGDYDRQSREIELFKNDISRKSKLFKQFYSSQSVLRAKLR